MAIIYDGSGMNLRLFNFNLFENEAKECSVNKDFLSTSYRMPYDRRSRSTYTSKDSILKAVADTVKNNLTSDGYLMIFCFDSGDETDALWEMAKGTCHVEVYDPESVRVSMSGKFPKVTYKAKNGKAYQSVAFTNYREALALMRYKIEKGLS